MKQRILFVSTILFIFISDLNFSDINDPASYRWKLIGPRGGFVQSLVPDRGQPHVWYTISDSKLYRSNDWAKTWNKILDNITEVAVHPYTSEVLAFGSVRDDRGWRTYLWHGRKSGRSWNPSRSDWFNAILWNPSSSKAVYGATSNGEFLESNDGGYSWRKKGKFPPWDENEECYFSSRKILVSPFDKRTIYLLGYVSCEYCCSHWELRVSTDGGRNWKTSDYHVTDIYWDPLDPDRAFAANCYNVAELTAKGWKPISDVSINRVVSVPGEPNHFYGAGGCGYTTDIMESKDDCKTWKVAEHLQSDITTMAIAADPGKSLLLGTDGGGIFKRLGPHSWKSITQGFKSASIYHIARSVGGKMLYASTGGGEILFKKDESRTFWTGTFPGPPKQDYEHVEFIVANPKDENHLFLMTSYRMFVSKNGGQTWRSPIGLGSYYYVHDVVFDNPSRPRLVYVVSGNALLSSKDGGVHFYRVANLRATDYTNLIRIIVDPENSRLLYVVSSDGIFKSSNSGESFQLIKPPTEVEIEDGALLGDPDHFLIVSQGEVYRTIDSGSHWEKISHLPLDYSWEFKRLLPADAAGKRFVVLLEYGRSKFLESKDGALSWNSQELASDVNIYDMTDPLYGPIYLATNKGVLMQK